MRSAMAISYPEGVTLGVKFAGTHRLPRSVGEANVERKRGATEIEIKLDNMKPATRFGGDFATYILWTVSPQGQAQNAGEFILRGDESRLEVTTPLQTFGMFVTAEPHFLVKTPSRFIVLENTRPVQNITGRMITTSTIQYRGFDGVYDFNRESLAGEAEVKGETRSDVRQAKVAIELAERAGAGTFAADELAKARQSWQRTINAAEAGLDDRQLVALGHETVRLAVKAEDLARERAYQAALEAERRARANEIGRLETEIKQARTEAERARLTSRYKDFQLAMEKSAREQAQAKANDAARKGEMEARRRDEAEKQALEARRRADELAQAKFRAEFAAGVSKEAAERARRERDAERARLKEALGKVAETRETARGLVVSLPDILFDFDSATLRPEAKETLSKLCGVMLVTDGQTLSVEGHTDSIGSEEYNLELSERRAETVRNYMTACGLSSDMVSSEGYGESQPIASNDTAEGRQTNRRVDIVVQSAESVASSGGSKS
jgi:outer membrane protein OmpA-like peptidoglycan-associated protein